MRAIGKSVIENLKHHPLALVLVVVNVLFLAVAAYTLREISASGARRDALLAELSRDCHAAPKGDLRK